MAGLPGRFRQVWNVDFEFRRREDNSDHPWPLCMVAREFHSRRELRLWRDDLLRLRTAPIDTGENSLIVAYAVAAEVSCFLVMGWPLPANILDLYAEHLLDINGLKLPSMNGLIAAMGRHGLPTMAASQKRRCATRSSIRTVGRRMRCGKYCPIAPMTLTLASDFSRRWPASS
jgi:hypothetical protein